MSETINRNVATGLCYGFIKANRVTLWADRREENYMIDCPFCGEGIDWTEDTVCIACKMPIHRADFGEIMPTSYSYGDEDYFIDQESTDDELLVITSPFFTYCEQAKIIKSGAGDLCKDGYECKAYCLGHEWFENGAPYKVYSVETGEEIKHG